jgi:hypothetical protein
VFPVFSAESRTEGELRYAQFLHDSIVHYAELVLECEEIWGNFDEFRRNTIRTAANFISSPTAAEAATFQAHGSMATLDHDGIFTRPLCKPLTFHDIPRITGLASSRKDALVEPLSCWLEGSSALSEPHVRLAVKAMLFFDDLRNRLTG